MNVLFVCTGNINRSAAAELIARKYRPSWNVRSAATNKKFGKPMARLMRDTLADKNFVGMEEHRSTALTRELVQWADVVIGFQPSHLAAVEQLGKRARTLTEFSSPHVPKLSKVPDPHFDSSGKTHRIVVALLLDAIPNIPNKETPKWN